MSKITYYQQGDVVLVKLDSFPNTVAADTALKTKVIQEGEHTGHAHRITGGAADLYQVGEQKYLRAYASGASITHEEHLPVEIEEGEYEVRIVRQKDPFTKLVSRVID